MIAVLDLFCGAAGGWSLGLHRAGFVTVAACEIDGMRRAVFLQNFPDTRMYNDIRELTAKRLRRDLGYLPDVIVGSPPCQDASAANTKGKGVDGARTGLFFEALRLVRECRPRWCAFENSPRLRTRGSDRLLAELEADGYAPWPGVVGADHVGANHERKRLWLIAADAAQIGQPWILRAPSGQWRRQVEHAAGVASGAAADAEQRRLREQPGRRRRPARREATELAHPAWDAHDGASRSIVRLFGGAHADDARDPVADTEGATRRAGLPAAQRGARHQPADLSGDPDQQRRPLRRQGLARDDGPQLTASARADCKRGHDADADGDRKPNGALDAEMGRRAGVRQDAGEPWADWNGGLAGHLRLDAGLSARLARARYAPGPGRTAGASGFVTAAYGDAVLPQITEAVGRAILRTEFALEDVFGGAA